MQPYSSDSDSLLCMMIQSRAHYYKKSLTPSDSCRTPNTIYLASDSFNSLSESQVCPLCALMRRHNLCVARLDLTVLCVVLRRVLQTVQ